MSYYKNVNHFCSWDYSKHYCTKPEVREGLLFWRLVVGWLAAGDWLAAGWRLAGGWLSAGWRLANGWLVGGWLAGWMLAGWLASFKNVSQFFFHPFQDIFIMRF